ncbi:hypothetical protein [Pseudomonas putida]|uniref:Antitoxin Xre/MbcA/ParS-like toxin-binding domain-containing protein n=1 Tax=Pseudomonas putida (strain DOT-T1E) TaxID=1196325 RepID=I7CAX4_PSEPT|nr:hypothetical protein [Pseudomonas putida]AFO50371.1 hypothetical protein T1E_4542 [Pseudomonas putida DOT-T1E]UZM95830.1 MbcA/ParS/Xre antitoxin family protein [Pseudomonas putida DOT-T1E]
MYRLLELGLVSRHASLFRKQGHQEEAITFECMNGWFDLIASNLQVVERYAELQRLEIEVVDVKEKFGLLRIYQHGGDEVIDRALDIAELVSGCVCEICGGLGSVSERQGWLHTRCHLHQDQDAAEHLAGSKQGYIDSYAKTVALLLWFFKEHSIGWVNQECLGLGGRRPFELLASSEGCEEIYVFIRRLDGGVGV